MKIKLDPDILEAALKIQRARDLKILEKKGVVRIIHHLNPENKHILKTQLEKSRETL